MVPQCNTTPRKRLAFCTQRSCHVFSFFSPPMLALAIPLLLPSAYATRSRFIFITVIALLGLLRARCFTSIATSSIKSSRTLGSFFHNSARIARKQIYGLRINLPTNYRCNFRSLILAFLA